MTIKVFSVKFQLKRASTNKWDSNTVTTDVQMGSWSASEAKAQILKHYGSTFVDVRITDHVLKREFQRS